MNTCICVRKTVACADITRIQAHKKIPIAHMHLTNRICKKLVETLAYSMSYSVSVVVIIVVYVYDYCMYVCILNEKQPEIDTLRSGIN